MQVELAVRKIAHYFHFGTPLLPYTTVTVSSHPIPKEGSVSGYQAILSNTAGACSATIVIEATAEEDTAKGIKNNWLTLGTITLSDSTVLTDGFSTFSSWGVVRARVTAIAGTGAKVEVIQCM